MTFWKRLDELLESRELIIDRPKGTRHPKYSEVVYPLDYGYLKGTSAGDGNEIDVWSGSDPSRRLVAVVCTVDTLKADAEVKLLVGCTDEEMEIVESFHNDNNYMSAIVLKRELEYG